MPGAESDEQAVHAYLESLLDLGKRSWQLQAQEEHMQLRI